MRPDLSTLAFALVLALLEVLALAGCGASRTEAGAPAPSAKGTSAPEHGDGGFAASPAAKPFAGSPTEATQLIGAAIDKHSSDLGKCIAEYRARKKLPHERVEISVGIDQDGRLLGATLKGGKADAVLSDCAQRALAEAPFPRSRAGVIQITKSFEEIAQ